MDAYARAWSPVGSMLEDGARHRAPMTGSSVTEQCGRSDENVLISGDCGRADAIHGGRREVMWEDVCAQQGYLGPLLL